MKSAIKIIITLIDRFVYLILLPFSLVVIYIISHFYKTKTQDNYSQNETQNNKILFLASGKPIKYPGFQNIDYYNMWHEAFQKQLKLPYFSSTYIFYSEAEKKEIYQLTTKVIAIAQPIWKNVSFFRRLQSLYMFLKSFIFISSIISRIQPRIIYSNAPGANMFMAPFLSYFYGIDLVAQVMGSYDLASYEDCLEKEPLKKLLRRNIDKIIFAFFFRQASLVLAYNKYCGDFAIHNGAHPSKVRNMRITPAYYDENKLNILSKRQIEFPKTEKNIILWNRFSSEKKNIFAIKGALEALKKDTTLGFILVGYGPMYEQVKCMIDSSGVADRVVLHGYKPFHELMSYIHYSEIALIPLGGYTLVEAALMKKPIVCFDIEWHQELLSDGAYIVDYPDEEQIENAIFEIINNPTEAERKAEKAYQTAKNMFCPTKIANREQEIIRKFLHGK